MGIQGLLPLVKSIMVPIHIKDLEGSNVAVDTYSWLHKGALSCSRELCKSLPTSRHVEYCMRRVNLLRHYGVKPILVFDGGLLPMKIEQENKRSRMRKENLERAVEHERSGNSAAAYECYQKAVDISPSIARELIQVLRQENVSYVVAPYEADAQMTFLAVTKHVEAVITEDSDLIPFGCPRIIFKMDKFGQAVEFQYSTLQNNKELNFDGFTRQMLLEMCILSGCDYLPSLPGMGLKRAHALIRKFKSYEKVLKHLRFSTVSVPPSYEDSFKKAVLTFQYQRVYDPLTEDIVHLSELPESVGDDIDFLGPSMPKYIAQGIANGDLDPFTKQPFQEQSLDDGISTQRILCSKTFNPESSRKKLDLPVQKNLLTNYFCFASLEAKRKFKAPRRSPGSPSPLENSSASPQVHENTGHHTCEMNGFLTLQIDSQNSGNSTPDTTGNFSADNSELREFPLNDVKIEDERSSPKQTLLREPRNSIHKPCLTIQREREFKSMQENSFQVKMEVESRKVVRSPYFQQKPLPKKNNDDDQENFIDIADDQINLSKSTMSRFRAKIEVEKRKVVWSRFFQHKPVPKNNKDDKQENLNDVVDVQINLNKSIISQRAPDGSNIMNKAPKRKTSPNNNLIRGNFRPKQMHVHTPIPHNGCYDTKMDKVVTESEPQDEKFGSNISHLGHYSEVATESVERFASIISKFKWTPGSRVSGLRPPLRDVKNTNTNTNTNTTTNNNNHNHNRLKVLDFSQFEYVPPNKKQR